MASKFHQFREYNFNKSLITYIWDQELRILIWITCEKSGSRNKTHAFVFFFQQIFIFIV